MDPFDVWSSLGPYPVDVDSLPHPGDWGAAFLGTARANVLILLGACKLLALLDLWVLNLMPRITCLCVACMMGAHPLLPP